MTRTSSIVGGSGVVCVRTCGRDEGLEVHRYLQMLLGVDPTAEADPPSPRLAGVGALPPDSRTPVTSVRASSALLLLLLLLLLLARLCPVVCVCAGARACDAGHSTRASWTTTLIAVSEIQETVRALLASCFPQPVPWLTELGDSYRLPVRLPGGLLPPRMWTWG